MTKNNHFVSEVNVRVVQSLLVQRTAIDDVNVVEPRYRAPNLWINMIAALLIWLTSDDDDLLKLDLVKVPRSQRHYETFDG